MKMTENFKILAEFVKDMSSEIPNIQSYMFVKENIGVFHVVAGSFSIEENSFTRLSQLKSKGYSARKIGQNKFGLFQVAYSSFNTRSEADIALVEIRLSDNQAAWILNKEIN